MKLNEIVDPFEEPTLTKEEEIAYLKHRMTFLSGKMDQLIDKIDFFKKNTSGIRQYYVGRYQFKNDLDLVTIPTLVASPLVSVHFYVLPDTHNEHEKYSQLMRFREQALRIKQEYTKAQQQLKQLLK